MRYFMKTITGWKAVAVYLLIMFTGVNPFTQICVNASDDMPDSQLEKAVEAPPASEMGKNAPTDSGLGHQGDLLETGESGRSGSSPHHVPADGQRTTNQPEEPAPGNPQAPEELTPEGMKKIPPVGEDDNTRSEAASQTKRPTEAAKGTDPEGMLKLALDFERQKKYSDALELYELAAQKSTAAGNKKLCALAVGGAARASFHLGKDKEALALINHSISIHQTLKNARARSLDHIFAARVLAAQARHAEALESLNEAMKILPASEASEIPELLELTANCEIKLGRNSDAIKTLTRLLNLYVKNGNAVESARVSIRIGEMSLSRSDYRTAKEYLKKSEKIYREQRQKKELAETLFRIAYLEQILGDVKTAKKITSEGLDLLAGEEGQLNSALPLMVKGINAGYDGNTVQATECLAKSVTLFEADGDIVMAARARLAMANLQFERSRLKSALELAGMALEAFRSQSSISGEASALFLIGEVYFYQGFIQKALEYAREASVLSKKISDKDLIVQSGIFLAEIHNSLGDTDFTSKVLRETVEESKSGLNPRTRANLRLAIARYWLSRESLDKALQDAAEAQKEFGETSDRRGIADSKHLMGLSYELKGETQKSLSFLQQSLREHQAIWDRFGEGRDLTALGVHYKNQGDYDKALEYAYEAANLRKGIGDRRGQAANLANIGNILRLKNQLSEAQMNLEQALSIYKELNDKKGEADSLTNLGQIEMAKGMESSALEKFVASLKLHRDIKDNRGAATDLTSMGKVYLARGDLENASSVLDEAARLSRTIRNPRGEIIILGELAMLQRAKNNFSSAISLLKQALEIARQTSDSRALSAINLKMAGVLEDAGEYEKALELFRQTLSTMRQQGDRKGELWALSGIGIIQAKTEDYENALRNLIEAVQLRSDIGVTASQSRELDFYLGEIYEGFRDFDRALEHYQKAISPAQAPGSEALLGRIYDRIGNIYYSMEEYPKARDFLDDALRISAETRNVAVQKGQLIRLGDISSKMGDAETALKYQQKALTLTRETQDQRSEARTLTRIGTLNQILGRPRVALENYQEAKEIRSKLGDRRGVNENLVQIALVTSILGDSDTAVEDLKQAFSIAQSSQDQSMMWKAYFIMGRTLESKKSLGEALESYRKAIAILEAMEADTIEESPEDEFIFGGKRALFETTLRVLMTLARKDPEGEYDGQALRIAERLNATDFEKTLSATNVESFSNLPNDLLIKEKSLKLSIQRINNHLEEERSKIKPNTTQMNKLLEERKSKEKSFKELKERLATEYPTYSQLRYPRPVAVHQLQRSVIDPDEAVLAFMVTRGKTYLFAMDKHRFHTSSIDYSWNEIEKDVDALIRPLHRAETQASWDPSIAYRLYAKLIKPVEYFFASKSAVVIIPHGPLSALPFEILVDSKAHSTKRFWSANDRPSYLVEKYAFCYEPSVSVFAQVRSRSRGKNPGWNLVAFGDADYIDIQKSQQPNPGSEKLLSSINFKAGSLKGQDLSPLPGTRKEISEIVKIVGGATQTYFGPQATETLFKKADLARYNYIHLATHGVLLNGSGKLQHRPGIIFSLFGDRENDGFLQLGEVFGLKLNSDLVVLSSCLAPGKTDQTESIGLTGLARAFLFAGTDSVILSMWQVNDQSTANFFVDVYRNLKEASKAEALRQAKVALLKNSGTSHPYCWGSFVLMGDWRVRTQPAVSEPIPEKVQFKGLFNWRRLLSF